MDSHRIITVALPTPLRKLFDYRLPSELIPTSNTDLIGCRVRVPFGKQTLIGMIVAIPATSDYAPDKIKAVDKLLDANPIVDGTLLQFFRWAADYYLHPLGEVIATALPIALRQGDEAQLQSDQQWKLTEQGRQTNLEDLRRAPKQAALLHRLQLLNQDLNDTDLKSHGISRAQLRPLEDKGLVRMEELLPQPRTHEPLMAQPHLDLSEEQQRALDTIAIDSFSTQLLFGDTGSGKTEIYLQVLEQVLRRGQQALILVPEIGLTPQTIHRFQARFNRTIAVLHSNLNDSERKQAWLMACSGIADIVIGTRSAIFTPLPRPGLIIIDEEHDNSLKQQDGFRYHARDLAVVRAQRNNIPLILGSATPSLESLHNASSGRYQVSRLRQRAGQAVKPTTEIIDLRNQTLQDGLSQPLIQQISQTLEAGQQALVFINRRGYSPTLLCHHCGWQAQCPRCDAKLTVHQQPPHMHCHHCDYQRPIARQCPTCRSHDLQYVGQGTERSEEALSALFPETPVIRVDRDSTRRKDGMNEILQTVHEGHPCILVGTQMLAKGHHLPNVTLVAILDADSGLFSVDFRGLENFGQLLLQVSGRAGRADKPGHVVIQTHLSDHPLLQTLIHQGYHPFAQQTQRERQLANLPPYSAMAMLRAESKRADNAFALLDQARQFLDSLAHHTPEVNLVGPLPAPMEKRNERYRYQLQLVCSNRQLRQRLCSQLLEHLESQALARRVRWSLDIDPQDMS